MTISKNSSDTAGAPTAEVQNSIWISAMPFIFVFLWSSGFIVAKFGLPYAPALTFLVLRFLGAIVVLLPIVILMRAPWPATAQGWHIALAGVLVQAGYLGSVWSAIQLGMPAGVIALIVGLQPILTAFAAPMVGESVRGRQWVGLMFGLCGVALVVANKISIIGLSWQSIALGLLALMSMTIGTLYQKRFCPSFDLRTGTIIQFAASVAVLVPFAIAYENFDPMFSTVQWTPEFIWALIWSVFAISIVAIFLLFALIRKSAATQVTTLLYLTPPTTAVMAWLMFGEAFSIIGIFGMILAVIGVALVVRK